MSIMLCPLCGMEPDGPMLLGAHADCVEEGLAKLLDPDWEVGMPVPLTFRKHITELGAENKMLRDRVRLLEIAVRLNPVIVAALEEMEAGGHRIYTLEEAMRLAGLKEVP